MGLAARVVTRPGRARPVCDSGRGPGSESPGQSPRRAVRCGAVRGVPSASGSRGSGSRSHQDPPRAWPGDAEVWPAGSAGGTGRGLRSGRMPSSRRSRGGVRGGGAGGGSRSLRNFARRAGDSGRGKLCPRGTEQSLGGGGERAGRRPSAVCFFSLPAAAAGDEEEEEDGGAQAERPRPPGVTVAPSGFPAPLLPPPFPQGPGHACAVRGGRPDLAS